MEDPALEGKIERAQIPDEDMAGWIATLREGGMSDAEIDEVLEHANLTYYEQRLPKTYRNQFDHVVASIERKRGSLLSPAERERLLDAFRIHQEKMGQR